ncbi:MAG TPA: Yip1 family protein [Gammaproteobacteria bacterium]|nr:Yip1 family protein [Gammaproteobacteria bacterium]
MFDPKRTIELVKGALLAPEPTWAAYLGEAGDWKKTAALLTGPLIVAAAVIAYVLGNLSGGPMGFRPTLTSLVLSIISGAVAITVVTFIFSGLAAVFGGKHDFARGLAATSLAFVPGYVGQALGPLPWIGWLIALGMLIYGLVLLWRIIPVYLEVPDAKRAPHYALSLLASVVAMVTISVVIGGGMMGRSMGPGMAGGMSGMSGMSGSSADASGLFGGIARQGELIGLAEEDRYDPPSDGRLTEGQVREFIRVMQRASEASAERSAQLQAIAERAESNENVSLSDLGAMMTGITQVAGLNTVEIEIVKSAGGNWAEHQWVKDSLRTAWLQKDINDTVTHNYALYQEYEAELSALLIQ